MRHCRIRLVVLSLLLLAAVCGAQKPQTAVELGSQTARNGFKNEDEIRDKFNNWAIDDDAKAWLSLMGYELVDIRSVVAKKPYGKKSDVDVTVKTKAGEKTVGISIKLVSSRAGFNQIDKRWLSHYVRMWEMPSDVESVLKLFLGEVPPTKPGRSADRMFLNEIEPSQRQVVVDFFAANKEKILRTLFRGDGPHAATWFMVALKAADATKWVLRRDEDVMKFFGEGKVEITRAGNLKIGRVTMQRKGGDGGRETARMLQFKINPLQLFDAK